MGCENRTINLNTKIFFEKSGTNFPRPAPLAISVNPVCVRWFVEHSVRGAIHQFWRHDR
jgi:hypothetical protein